MELETYNPKTIVVLAAVFLMGMIFVSCSHEQNADNVPTANNPNTISATSTSAVLACSSNTCWGTSCTICGTSGNDTINGTSGNDVICGLDGNDQIYGLGGSDLICGGYGYDGLDGGAGNDELHGGIYNDFLDGNSGTDSCDGGGGLDDTCIGTCETATMCEGS